jgi:hypothetical protein
MSRVWRGASDYRPLAPVSGHAPDRSMRGQGLPVASSGVKPKPLTKPRLRNPPMLIAAILIVVFACLAGALLWRLAVYALPLWCGGAAALAVYRADAGIVLSFLAGAAAAMAILIVGHLALGATRSPLLRAGIGLAFAIPAAIAGYHAAHGIAAAFGGAVWSAAILSALAAVITGGAAWGGILRSTNQS